MSLIIYGNFNSDDGSQIRRLAHVGAALHVRDNTRDVVFCPVPAETARDDALPGAAGVAGHDDVGVCFDYPGLALDVEFVGGGLALGLLLKPVKHPFDNF